MLADAVTCRYYRDRQCALMPTETCIKLAKVETYCKNWSNWRTRDASYYRETKGK